MRMCLALGCLLMGMLPAVAQAQAPEPTVTEVLTRVEGNFRRYLETVPNLIADEYLTTNVDRTSAVPMPAPGSDSHGVEAESTFTLRRGAEDAGKPPKLTESREIKVIDHKPAKKGAKLDTPVMFSGAFSYASSFLLVELTACYNYKLQTNQSLRGRPVLMMEYATKDNGLRPAAECVVREPLSGRAYLDPETMQIVRLEQRRPQHTLEGQGDGRDTVDWEWTIDYAPVELDRKTFWLANTVSSKMRTNPGPRVVSSWTFVANYRNYHLLAAHSTILPGFTVER